MGVHIADVAHFVHAGSPLDRAARNRGTSVYLPDRVIPMLPEILSNSLASLQAGRTRYTVSAHLDFNPEGILTAQAIRAVGDQGRPSFLLRAGPAGHEAAGAAAFRRRARDRA